MVVARGREQGEMGNRFLRGTEFNFDKIMEEFWTSLFAQPCESTEHCGTVHTTMVKTVIFFFFNHHNSNQNHTRDRSLDDQNGCWQQW